MTAQETANCVYALSKFLRKAYKTVFTLTQHLRENEILNSLKPQEATAILYGLGRLDIRDEWFLLSCRSSYFPKWKVQVLRPLLMYCGHTNGYI